MTDITQVITALPTAPNPVTQTPDQFDTAATAFVAALDGMVTEENTFGSQANVLAGEVNVNAATATTKASEASASASASAASAVTAAGVANYAGLWSSLTGAQVAGISVAHLGSFWLLLENVADVTIEVPGTSTKWGYAFGASQLEERAANVELVAEDNGQIIKITANTFTQTFDAAENLGTNWSITYYNGGTGIITLDPDASEVIDVTTVNPGHIVSIFCDGAAFKTIVSAAPIGDHSVVVTTGNGMGSTNTKIRRFTTTQSSSGTAITYADSATLGASFTINETGFYSILYMDNNSSAAYNGVSLNSSELTTSILTITAADRLLIAYFLTNGNNAAGGETFYLTAGDVIRPHCNTALDSTSAIYDVFRIRKVGV